MRIVIVALCIIALAGPFLMAMPPVFATDPNDLYTLSDIYTFASGFPTTMPSFAYVNGILLATYGPAGAGCTAYRTSSDGGRNWSAEGVANDFPDATGAQGELAMIVDGSRIIGMFIDNHGYPNIIVVLAYSDNNGATWTKTGSPPARGSWEYTATSNGIRTQDGYFIMPGACHVGPLAENYVSFCWICNKNKDPTVASNWVLGGDVPGSAFLDEPVVFERAPAGGGHLGMFIREDNGDNPNFHYRMGYSESDNYGMTWSPVTWRGDITNTYAPMAVYRLSWSPDRIILCWDNNPTYRTPLVVAIIDNGGSIGPTMTITTESTLGNPYAGVCYPSLTTTTNGEIVVGWLRLMGYNQEQTQMLILIPKGGSTYEINIIAFCDNESQNVEVQASCFGQTKTTPCTFSGLLGSNVVTIASADLLGHSFRSWDTGETSTTLTVSTSGPHTAYYGQAISPPIPYQTIFIVGGVVLVGGLVASKFGLLHQLNKPKKRRRR